MSAPVYTKVVILGTAWYHIAVGQTESLAYIVVNGKNGHVLAAHQADRLQQPASLTKKMTLRLLFEALRRKTISLRTRFKVPPQATVQIPSKLGLQAGQSISVKDLIHALVIKSANDAAYVVATGLCGQMETFVARMNQRAKQLGMLQTHFQNPAGTPDDRQYSTAKDMVRLAQSLYRDFPEYCHYFQLRGFHYNRRFYKSHNHLLGRVPGLDGIKTGYVAKAGFCISTSAVRYQVNGQPVRLFAVFLGGQTAHLRDQQAQLILEEQFQKLGATFLTPPCSEKKLSVILSEFRSSATKKVSRRQEKKMDRVDDPRSDRSSAVDLHSKSDPHDAILPKGWVRATRAELS